MTAKKRAVKTKHKGPRTKRPMRATRLLHRAKLLPPERRVQELLDQAYKQIPQLLAGEKRRRGVSPSQLVFVGMHNVAQYKWCAMYAVLKSRANEEQFFLAHLEDRVGAALRLGRPLPPNPKTPADLLTVGSDIKWTDLGPKRRPKGLLVFDGDVSMDEVIAAVMDGVPPSDPMARGTWAESRFAKRLQSVRWSFEWGCYVVVGIPDGIGKDFVYEFKCTQSDYMLMFQRPVSHVQADLYGFFFGKPRKRIEIRVEKEDHTERIEEDVDRDNAESVLAKFAQLDAGGEAQRPKPWKCKNCDLRDECPWLVSRQ